jgi:hypothetical protein
VAQVLQKARIEPAVREARIARAVQEALDEARIERAVWDATATNRLDRAVQEALEQARIKRAARQALAGQGFMGRLMNTLAGGRRYTEVRWMRLVLAVLLLLLFLLGLALHRSAEPARERLAAPAAGLRGR